MNKTYRTIRNPLTGRTVAAPESAASRRRNAPRFLLRKIGAALALALPAGAFAQLPTLIYDGTTGLGKLDLRTMQILDWSAPRTGAGYYAGDGKAVASGADLVIDYAVGSFQNPEYVLGGGSPAGGDVFLNTVTIRQGSIQGNVYGGLSPHTVIAADVDKSGMSGGYGTDVRARAQSQAIGTTVVNAYDNTVTVQGNSTTVTGSLYGGYAVHLGYAGSAKGGSHTITGTDPQAVAEASAFADADSRYADVRAENNAIVVTENAFVTGDIHGGHAAISLRGGEALGGAADSAQLDDVYAWANADAYVFRADMKANGNALTVAGQASVAGDIHGGQAVINAHGGEAQGGTANSSTVGAGAYALVDGAARSNVHSSSLEANANTVTVTGQASVTGDIHGGQTAISARGGEAQGGTADSNSIEADAYANASASWSTLHASGNTVIVTERASVTGNIYGGQAAINLRGGEAEGGTATGYGSGSGDNLYARAYAGAEARNTQARAIGNDVTVTEHASVTGSLYGGHAVLEARGGNASGGSLSFSGMHNYSSTSDAEVDLSGSNIQAAGNEVALDGRLQDGSIYGGYVRFMAEKGTAAGNDSVDLSGSMALATDNIVTIGDHATLSGNVSLYGGFLDYNTADGYAPASYDVFSGNTLNFSAQPVTVHTVANFEKYNFTLRPSLANQSSALIEAQKIVLGSSADNHDAMRPAKDSKIEVVGIHSGSVLHAGDRFVLMRAADLAGNGTGLASTGLVQQGISLLYDVQTHVDLAGKKVTAEILACQTGTGTGGPRSGRWTSRPSTWQRTSTASTSPWPAIRSTSKASIRNACA